MDSLRARPLTPGEESYLRKHEGKAITFSGPLSIIGRSDHMYVRSTGHSDLAKLYRVDLGYGQYITETIGRYGPAEGGTTVPIVWSTEQPIRYLLYVAEELGIPYFYSYGLVYFQNKFESAFAKCVGYVDRTLLDYENKRSLLDRWFFPSQNGWDSAEAQAIREEVRRILTTAKKV